MARDFRLDLDFTTRRAPFNKKPKRQDCTTLGQNDLGFDSTLIGHRTLLVPKASAL
jgi:hypothetical protein